MLTKIQKETLFKANMKSDSIFEKVIIKLNKTKEVYDDTNNAWSAWRW